MKRPFIICVLCFLASPGFAEVKESDMMRGARLDEVTPPKASIIVGANESVGSIVEPGWPVIVGMIVLSEERPEPALPSNLVPIVTDNDDQTVTIAFAPVPAPAGSDPSQMFWIAAESATQALAPGRYRVSVMPVAGFASESGHFTVVEPKPENAGMLGFLKIQRAILSRQDDEALAECDRQIAADPENPNVWIAKGDILMARDLPDEAADAYEKALALEMANNSEPLFIQNRLKDAFFRSLEKRGVLTNPLDAQP
jgi:hypothetical protein